MHFLFLLVVMFVIFKLWQLGRREASNVGYVIQQVYREDGQ